MMAAKPGHAPNQAAQGGAGKGAVASNRTQQKQEDERSPYAPVQHLWPHYCTDVRAQSENQSTDERSELRESEVAAEQIAEQRGHAIDRQAIPLECDRADVTMNAGR